MDSRTNSDLSSHTLTVTSQYFWAITQILVMTTLYYNNIIWICKKFEHFSNNVSFMYHHFNVPFMISSLWGTLESTNQHALRSPSREAREKTACDIGFAFHGDWSEHDISKHSDWTAANAGYLCVLATDYNVVVEENQAQTARSGHQTVNQAKLEQRYRRGAGKETSHFCGICSWSGELPHDSSQRSSKHDGDGAQESC